MLGPEEDDVKTKQRLQGFVKWNTFATLLFTLIVGGFYLFESIRAERLWAALIDELETAGEPTSLS